MNDSEVVAQFQEELEKGVRTLVRRDPVIRNLKRKHGLPTFHPRTDYFAILVRSIISQQISGRAAATIIGRVEHLLGGLDRIESFAEVGDDELRQCGVSGQKTSYLRSLVDHVESGTLQLDQFQQLDDQTIIDELVAVRGIGTWTAKMFMMFSLGRLDVLPWEDLGVRQGIMHSYAGDYPEGDIVDNRHTVEFISEDRRWSPYRSIASWYMWRSLETE